MIILILKMIFLTVSWSLGWRVIISEGMLFERIGVWAQDKVDAGNKFYELLICPWCLPNFMGVFFVWPLAFGLEILPFECNWKYLLMYPFCLSASSFITGFVWTLYLTMNAKREYYTQVNEYKIDIEESK